MTSTRTNPAGAGGTGPGCGRVCARLAELIDGGLAPLETARDRGHLEACAPCREALSEEERLLGAIRRAALERAGELHGDVERVASAVRRELDELERARPARTAAAPRRRTVAALVASAAAILLAFVLHTRGASAPERIELAGLDPVLEHIPSFEDVLRSLGNLSRGGS